MSVEGKVLIARFALKQFFHSDFGDFILEFEKSISKCLNTSLQIIKSVKNSFNRLGQYQYQRRVKDDLTLHLDLNTDEYPACMPDLYIGFKESEGTTGVYRDDEKIIRLYTGVSSGKDVPVMMTVRFTGCDGSVLSESSHGTFCSVGPSPAECRFVTELRWSKKRSKSYGMLFNPCFYLFIPKSNFVLQMTRYLF